MTNYFFTSGIFAQGDRGEDILPNPLTKSIGILSLEVNVTGGSTAHRFLLCGRSVLDVDTHYQHRGAERRSVPSNLYN
jgi:hypothetical protein